MEAFGIYSLKAGIILIVFWGIYRLFLQKETFYRFNRIFLLTGLIAALLLPLYTIHYTVEISTNNIPTQLLSNPESISPSTDAGTGGIATLIKYCNSLLPVIYVVVLFILLVVRFIGLSHLIKMIRFSEHKRYPGFNLIESSEFKGAFSFFRFVFIPKNLNESEKNIILKHEETHVAQNHWIDLFLTNILNLIWWFNPIIRFYEKAIRNNHEYLADKEVLSSYEQADYQQTLVNQWFNTPIFPMANSFSYSNRLKRINMMKKNVSNPAKKIFSLAAIPAIAIFLWACSEKDYVILLPDLEIATEQVLSSKDSTYLYSDGLAHKRQEGKIHEDGSISMFNGDFSVTFSKSGKISFEGQKEKPLVVIDDKITNMDINDILIENTNSMSTVASEDGIRLYGEKGKHGAVILTTKSDQKKPYTFNKTQKTASTSDNEISQEGISDPNYYAIRINTKNPIDSKPLLLVDNKKAPYSDLTNMNPDSIHSIDVLKDKTAIEIYGEEGINGVISVTTMNGKKSPVKTSADNINEPNN